MKANITAVTSAILMAGMLSGCLKTRAQLRDDENDQAQPIPVQVKDVQPQSYAIDEIKERITQLQGRIEDLERRQQDRSAANAQKDELTKLESRMTALEQNQQQILEAVQKMQAKVPHPEAYDQGKAALKAKKYDAAITALSQYLKTPKARHLEEATFLRAEAYYGAKQYKKAIIDYSKFPEKWPKSRHMPAALYRIGLSFDALGMRDDAKGFYQELVDKYSHSSEARRARSKLK